MAFDRHAFINKAVHLGLTRRQAEMLADSFASSTGLPLPVDRYSASIAVDQSHALDGPDQSLVYWDPAGWGSWIESGPIDPLFLLDEDGKTLGVPGGAWSLVTVDIVCESDTQPTVLLVGDDLYEGNLLRIPVFPSVLGWQVLGQVLTANPVAWGDTGPNGSRKVMVKIMGTNLAAVGGQLLVNVLASTP